MFCARLRYDEGVFFTSIRDMVKWVTSNGVIPLKMFYLDLKNKMHPLQ